MGPKRQVQIDGSKETDPKRWVQRDRSKKMGPNKLVKDDRMVQKYPNWSNMVQNQPKKCPNGSGITRFPGLVWTWYWFSFLSFILCSLVLYINMSLVFGFFVHLSANLLLKISLRSVNVSILRCFRFSLYVFLLFAMRLMATFWTLLCFCL